MSFDGFDESEFIMSEAGIGKLYGGRVWEDGVPEGVTIPKKNGVIQPYITTSFPSPIALKQGRGMAVSEARQPHLMSFTVYVHAGTTDDLKAATKAVVRKLVGLEPSTSGNAGEIQLRGGSASTTKDAKGAVLRMTRAILFQVRIGLGS